VLSFGNEDIASYPSFPLKTARQVQQCFQLADCSAAKVKKGRIKSGAAGQICGQILADFEQKGPKKAEL
jgi:hypothetical protein